MRPLRYSNNHKKSQNRTPFLGKTCACPTHHQGKLLFGFVSDPFETKFRNIKTAVGPVLPSSSKVLPSCHRLDLTNFVCFLLSVDGLVQGPSVCLLCVTLCLTKLHAQKKTSQQRRVESPGEWYL
mmetsp:Transcript_25767/g.59876  ORF Transcript_25767/g.59876 Transcript_25767/m.59876 type:complete len:125 (+) Transcript_25767:870-1244(+)